MALVLVGAFSMIVQLCRLIVYSTSLDTAPVTLPGPRTKQLLIRKPFLVDIYLDNEEMEDGIQRLLLSTDTLLWKCENQNVCQTLLQQVL